jgi:hypothetical protein
MSRLLAAAGGGGEGSGRTGRSAAVRRARLHGVGVLPPVLGELLRVRARQRLAVAAPVVLLRRQACVGVSSGGGRARGVQLLAGGLVLLRFRVGGFVRAPLLTRAQQSFCRRRQHASRMLQRTMRDEGKRRRGGAASIALCFRSPTALL